MKTTLTLIFLCLIGNAFSQRTYRTLKDSVFLVGDIIDLGYELRFPPRCNNLGLSGPIGTDSTMLVLDELALFLKERPDMKLEIGVHSDTRGSEGSNQQFSECRAQMIFNLLIENGVDSSQLVPVGYGESQPMEVYLANGKHLRELPEGEQAQKMTLTDAYIRSFYSNKLEYEHLHQMNRRVEWKVLRVEQQ